MLLQTVELKLLQQVSHFKHFPNQLLTVSACNCIKPF